MHWRRRRAPDRQRGGDPAQPRHGGRAGHRLLTGENPGNQPPALDWAASSPRAWRPRTTSSANPRRAAAAAIAVASNACEPSWRHATSASRGAAAARCTTKAHARRNCPTWRPIRSANARNSSGSSSRPSERCAAARASPSATNSCSRACSRSWPPSCTNSDSTSRSWATATTTPSNAASRRPTCRSAPRCNSSTASPAAWPKPARTTFSCRWSAACRGPTANRSRSPARSSKPARISSSGTSRRRTGAACSRP